MAPRSGSARATPQEDHQIAIEVGATVTATVVRIENYGAFLQLEDGRMGLVHIANLAAIRNARVVVVADADCAAAEAGRDLART